MRLVLPQTDVLSVNSSRISIQDVVSTQSSAALSGQSIIARDLSLKRFVLFFEHFTYLMLSRAMSGVAYAYG